MFRSVPVILAIAAILSGCAAPSSYEEYERRYVEGSRAYNTHRGLPVALSQVDGVYTSSAVSMNGRPFSGDSIRMGIMGGGDVLADLTHTITIRVDPNNADIPGFSPSSELLLNVGSLLRIRFEAEDILQRYTPRQPLDVDQEQIRRVRLSAANNWSATVRVVYEDVMVGRTVNVLGISGTMQAVDIIENVRVLTLGD